MAKQKDIVQIAAPDHPNGLGYRWINKSKFDPSVHTLYEDSKKTAAAKKRGRQSVEPKPEPKPELKSESESSTDE